MEEKNVDTDTSVSTIIVDGIKFSLCSGGDYYGSVCGKKTPLACYVYSKAYGEIPRGYSVIQLNGIRSDNRIENLLLVTSRRFGLERYNALPYEEKVALRRAKIARHIGYKLPV